MYNFGKIKSFLFLVVFCLCFVSDVALAEDGASLFRHGQKALDQGNYQKAISFLRRAVKLLPHWGLIHLELARALQFDGTTPKEIFLSLDKALKLIPNNPRVHARSALVWEGMGNIKKALKHYKKALQLGDTRPFVCLRATRLWLLSKQGKKAISCLKRLIRHKRERGQVHFLLARSYEQDRQYEKTAEQFAYALIYRPNWIPLLKMAFVFYSRYIQLGLSSSKKRRWKRKIRDIRETINRLIPSRKKRKLRPLLPSRR